MKIRLLANGTVETVQHSETYRILEKLGLVQVLPQDEPPAPKCQTTWAVGRGAVNKRTFVSVRCSASPSVNFLEHATPKTTFAHCGKVEKIPPAILASFFSDPARLADYEEREAFAHLSLEDQGKLNDKSIAAEQARFVEYGPNHVDYSDNGNPPVAKIHIEDWAPLKDK
jgi:hypothetical protein